MTFSGLFSYFLLFWWISHPLSSSPSVTPSKSKQKEESITKNPLTEQKNLISNQITMTQTTKKHPAISKTMRILMTHQNNNFLRFLITQLDSLALN
jgi:hypothetical protein